MGDGSKGPPRGPPSNDFLIRPAITKWPTHRDHLHILGWSDFHLEMLLLSWYISEFQISGGRHMHLGWCSYNCAAQGLVVVMHRHDILICLPRINSSKSCVLDQQGKSSNIFLFFKHVSLQQEMASESGRDGARSHFENALRILVFWIPDFRDPYSQISRLSDIWSASHEPRMIFSWQRSAVLGRCKAQTQHICIPPRVDSIKGSNVL